MRESLDDLLATVGDGIGIAGDVVEQASAAGGGVVDLVDVGAELAAPGGHARGGVSGADPFVAADGVDEQLLDLGAVVASLAIAAVPMRMPSSGILG